MATGPSSTTGSALAELDPTSSRLVTVDAILAKHGYLKSNLIAVLQDVQTVYHYLPEDMLNYVATALGTTPATVFGVATFYAQFSLDPKGKYIVRVCDGTACHVKNSMAVYSAIRKLVKLQDGRITTPDRLFTLETVACLGACGLAPVLVVNEQVHPSVTPDAARAIVQALMSRESESAVAGEAAK